MARPAPHIIATKPRAAALRAALQPDWPSDMLLSTPPVRSFVILGVTRDGRVFRPSDWAERLCGVMSSFRPGGAGLQMHITYSPYVMPGVHEGAKCVHVDARIHDIEPMAYKFLVGFARDNELRVLEQPSGSA